MLKRKILFDLEQWHSTGRSKTLLLTGARQVGKTTIVQFAKQHYSHFVEISWKID